MLSPIKVIVLPLKPYLILLRATAAGAIGSGRPGEDLSPHSATSRGASLWRGHPELPTYRPYPDTDPQRALADNTAVR